MAEQDNPPNEAGSLRSLPSNTVFALVDDPAAAERAEQALGAVGTAGERVQIWSGAAGAAALDAQSNQEGFFGQLAHALQAVGQDLPYLERYAEEVGKGRALIGAGFDSDEQREQIERILKESGGRQICSVGRWTVTVVE